VRSPHEQYCVEVSTSVSLHSFVYSGAATFNNQTAFEFGQDADHLPHGPYSVYRFGERRKHDTMVRWLIEHGYQVAQTAAQPVELPGISVSPARSVLRQRARAGRLVVAPDSPLSSKM